MKAEEWAVLGRKGAARVLDYYKSGGNIQLTEDDTTRAGRKTSGKRELQ